MQVHRGSVVNLKAHAVSVTMILLSGVTLPVAIVAEFIHGGLAWQGVPSVIFVANLITGPMSAGTGPSSNEEAQSEGEVLI